MRILFVSQYFPPEPGAPAARVSELAALWAKAGHQVTVLTGFPHHPTGVVPPEYRGRYLMREPFRGVNVIRTWIFAAANRGRLLRSFSYASFAVSAVTLGQWVVERPDVLIATSPQILCAVAGSMIARLRSVPFVFEVRDLWPESIVAVGAMPAGHPVIRGLEQVERRLYRQAKAIVVVTDSFKERLRERNIREEKLHVVKNGVDLGRFLPQSRATALRERLGWKDHFIVGYTGTHGMAHGLGAVLDVAGRLKEDDRIRFLFVGEGAERQALESRAREEGLDNVRFLGVLPREQMPQTYAAADLLLVPLRKSELFTAVLPSKIFEIMAMERPILLSVDGEARALVEASEGGCFVPPEDRDAMASAIVTLSRDSQRCRKMGTNGRRYVLDHYDRAVLARRYLGILEDVVGEAILEPGGRKPHLNDAVDQRLS